jgi:5'-phosphate synthase pdxT subunit
MLVTCSRNNTYNIVAGSIREQKKVGILALQGDVELHAQALAGLGFQARIVKKTIELIDLDGLVIPGGESTALLRLAESIGMLSAIVNFAKSGGSIFGTCAGAIILAHHVSNPHQQSLRLIDIAIERNGYGRQINSQETFGQAFLPLGTDKIPTVFIRAPRITKTGKSVTILATYKNEPVLVQQAKIMAATFHPELQSNSTVYEYWLKQL